MSVPIIDLFAGPGGLGEGFTSITGDNGQRAFRIALSIEKDEFAHKTLTLRAFFRQFPVGQVPETYYSFIRGEISLEKLYEIHSKEAAEAKREAWRFEVGDKSHHRIIDKRIKEGLKGEKNFILIGGPPCQAYSLVGRSRRQEKDGLDEEDERVFLYREYYRILARHTPQIFIMENVKGLLSSKVQGKNEFMFNQIIADLKKPFQAYIKLQGKQELEYSKAGYRIYSLVKPIENNLLGEEIFNPTDFIIRTEEYGIPQTRHRVILLGIRDDLDILPHRIEKSLHRISVQQVISDLPKLRSGLSKESDSKKLWRSVLEESIELNIWKGIDDDVRKKIIDTLVALKVPKKDRGGLFIRKKTTIEYNQAWYSDENLSGVCNHETRSHIKEDLYRYLFVSCFAKVRGVSPKLSDFPSKLLPKHLNIAEAINENKFADRFRVQLADQPAKTITSHISKDGHYYIHPDPSQCRSFTVREAARIQTFPDNYYFCGPRTQQFHQVGNAVPPYLAFQIAKIVDRILRS